MLKTDSENGWSGTKRALYSQPYATERMRDEFLKRMTRDGFESPLCYYRSRVDGRFDEQDSQLAADQFRIKVPYLFVAGTQMLFVVLRQSES